MSQTTILLCSGFHDFSLTQQLLSNLQTHLPQYNYLVFPTHRYPPYSTWHLNQFIEQTFANLSEKPIVFMAFSAGVVAAIGSALSLHQNYQTVQGLIAFDGWGVPLWGNFPIYRISHDYFTHWSSGILGKGKINFYADPEVNHLDLWRFPHQVKGWKVEILQMGNYVITPIILIDFLKALLNEVCHPK